MTAPDIPGYLTSQRNRAIAAAAALGFAAGSVVWHAAQRVMRRRAAQARAAARAQAAGPAPARATATAGARA